MKSKQNERRSTWRTYSKARGWLITCSWVENVIRFEFPKLTRRKSLKAILVPIATFFLTSAFDARLFLSCLSSVISTLPQIVRPFPFLSLSPTQSDPQQRWFLLCLWQDTSLSSLSPRQNSRPRHSSIWMTWSISSGWKSHNMAQSCTTAIFFCNLCWWG